MIAANPNCAPLWRDYKADYLARLSLMDRRHYETGKDILDRFTRYMDPDGTLTMDAINSRLLTEYLARRKRDPGRKSETLSVSTLNKEARYLNSAMSAAGQSTDDKPDRLDVMPADWRPPRLRRLKEPRRRPQPVPMPTLLQVLDGAKHATLPKLDGCEPALWWQAFYLVALVTGIRCEGLLEVPRPSEEDLDANRFRLPADDDKAGEDRVFWIPPMLVRIIRALPANPGERLFAWPYCRRYFYTVLHEWQLAAGIPRAQHALPHALKKTKGSLLTQQGCPLPLVSQELSHSNVQITASYYIGDLTTERVAAVDAMFQTLPIPEELRLRFDPEHRTPPPPTPTLRIYGDGKAS